MGGRPLDDDQLVDRAREGDADAYGRLVRRHQAVAFRTAWLITRNETEAEDATQDAFVKAYYALPRFHRGAPFRPWLLRIVSNEARNRLRSAGRRAGLALKASVERPSGDAAPSPESVALAHEQQHGLLEALERLSERDRLVVSCRYLLDLSEAETAAVLNCPTGTVKSRLSRALNRLRALVAEQPGEVLSREGGTS